ncbi:MAG: GNAT family N-acetyltransferase [Bacteroidota bacterium]
MHSTTANTDIKVLDLAAEDVLVCVDTFMASYNTLPWNYSWEKEDAVKYLMEYAGAPTYRGFILREGDAVAAALLGHTKTWWTGNQFMVDELFVSAASQGKGYGKALLAAAERFAQAANIERITLMTNKFMPALQFYNKNDFNKVDQYVFMFKQL